MGRTLFGPLTRWLKDPPPSFVFELSEAGIAWAEIARQPKIAFAPIERDVISVSPLRDNILRPETLQAQVRTLVAADGRPRRRRAALILPDYSVRVTVLDFDSFPSDAFDRLSLIRFRLKRTVPFDIESAALSFQAQPDRAGGKRVDVAVALAPQEIVSRYENPFRMAGFHTGLVTTSLLSALELVPAHGVNVLAKRTGRILSLAVLVDGILKLARSIEMDETSLKEISSHLFPTLAYVEDQLAARPDTIFICGFGVESEQTGRLLEAALGAPVRLLSSRWGQPGEFNSGVLGYLETVKDF